jgi:translation initiation factor 3 subunit E
VEADIQKAKIDLVQKTNMVDYAMDIYSAQYKQDPPTEMKERRNEVVAKLNTLQAQADSIVNFLSNASLVKLLKQDKAYNLQLLQEQYQIGPAQIEALYHFAKNKFECGNYTDAAEFLYHYRTLATNSERSLSALWGKLASEVLMENWEVAMEDLTKLKEIIDSNTFAPVLQQLQQRTWLMHWSLYIFFNHDNGRNQIVELFFQDRYLNTIQTTAQHLLRYLAAAVIVNKRRRNVMKDLIKVIEQESYEYSDPITEFLQCLFIDFDFEGAQQKLKECEEVLDHDYFLTAMKAEFVENARWFIFETYCRIHQCIDLRMLAEKLNMGEEAAERWIVNLIRDARLNAKIDSKAGSVVMGTSFPTAYEQITETAKGLSARTFMLANAVVGAPRA